MQSAITGQSVLFLSLPRHDGAYTSTPWQLATQLARNNKVIFVDQPFTFLDLLKGFFKPQIRKRLRAYWSAPISIKEQGVVVILAPFVWPINFLPKGLLYNFFSRMNHKILAKRVNKYLESSGNRELIYINSFNFYFGNLHRYLNAKILSNIYHCIDPMIKAFTLKHGTYLQKSAAENADAIVSTSNELAKQFEQYGADKNYVVANAANFTLFNIAAGTKKSSKYLDRKIIGYVGNIERRIDYNFLLSVLDRLPQWDLHMIGPVEKQYVPDRFLNHPRVKMMGTVPHREAPSAIANFDVAIIPFRKDEVSKGIYPLKLYEYMATGKPVVATDFNEEIFDGMPAGVATASTAAQFAEAVQMVYSTDDESKKGNRIKFAAENSWESRAVDLSNIISKYLPKTEAKYVVER